MECMFIPKRYSAFTERTRKLYGSCTFTMNYLLACSLQISTCEMPMLTCRFTILVGSLWWHISAITCQIIMLTCQIIMSNCQIFMLTCQIIMSTCQKIIITTNRLISCFHKVFMPLTAIYLSDNYVVICMALNGHVHVFMLTFLRRE